jgi:DNA-binding NarL/FixJ family response regulator
VAAGRGGVDATRVHAAGLLLVDDDASFRAAARALLAGAGFPVTAEAGTGREALAAAADVEPALVLLDIQLPDIDGFEVARRLTGQSLAPVVILISTREAIDYGRQVVDCGAAGFVTKARLSGTALRAILHSIGEARP